MKTTAVGGDAGLWGSLENLRGAAKPAPRGERLAGDAGSAVPRTRGWV